MIKHYFTRTRDGETSVCMDRELSKEKALQYFVDAELNYGSRLVHIGATEIKTTSSCFGCVDDMVFSGSAEDMRDLFEVAQAYAAGRNAHGTEANLFLSSRNQEFNRHATLFLTDLASARKPFLAAIWHMLVKKGAVPNETTRERDIHAAFDLIYIDNQDAHEVFAMCDIKFEYKPSEEVAVYEVRLRNGTN